MVGIASRYFAGRIALALVAAVVVGLATGLDGTGHVVMYSTVVLATAAGSFALMSSLSLTVGDVDSIDRTHAHNHRPLPNYWPIAAALGMGLVMVGLVLDAILTIFGVALLIVAAVEWTLATWSEHLSRNAAENEAQRQRLLKPFEISLFGALGIAIPVLLISRVFLAVSRNAASWIALGVAAAVLGFGFILYGAPHLRKRIVATVLGLTVVALIAGGIIAAAIGEREFHPHVSGESGEAGVSGEKSSTDGDHE